MLRHDDSYKIKFLGTAWKYLILEGDILIGGLMIIAFVKRYSRTVK